MSIRSVVETLAEIELMMGGIPRPGETFLGDGREALLALPQILEKYATARRLLNNEEMVVLRRLVDAQRAENEALAKSRGFPSGAAMSRHDFAVQPPASA